MHEKPIHDVVICGGGLAGLALARQLRRDLPERNVVVLDRLARPLPEAAFKVGEATVEVGGFYLGEILGLAEYLDREHLPKHGLRFFYGPGTGPVEERPEFGLSADPPAPSYLIDRGKLENHLRDRLVARGIDLREGTKVEQVKLGGGEEPHEVRYRNADGEMESVLARWVVDASGRRRLIQRELNLVIDTPGKCSAVWFRVEGRVSVRDLAAPESKAWHERVPARNRDLTVTHLVGRGYWVWIIPLSSNATSIGIVTDEARHEFADFNTRERAMAWLEAHEPLLGRRVAELPWLDFRVLRRYSYRSKHILSEDRWACVGEAAFFSDPLNSPGTDVIGFGNCIVVDTIRRDFAGTLDPKTVLEYDRFLCGLNELLTYQFQTEYEIFGHPVAAAIKVLWNVASAWSIYSPQMFNQTFLDPEKREAIRRATMGYFFLTRRMHALLQEWGSREPGRLHYELIDYRKIPLLRELALRNLRTGKTAAELAEDQRWNMERLEELAQVFFLMAVEDLMPEELERFPEPLWVNAWKIGLDPEKWEEQGLFAPTTTPRDLTPIRDQIRALFLHSEVARA